MKYREISTKEVDNAALLGTYASLEDVSEVIAEDTVLTIDDVPVIVYLRDLGMDAEPLRRAMSKVTWACGPRATKNVALANPTAKVFGFQPRLHLRNHPCNVSSLGLELPDLHKLLCKWTEAIAKAYKEIAPVTASAHNDETEEKVQERFRLAGSMFTSGIINKTNQLPYHFDGGNFAGAWSAMLGLTKWVNGGCLAIPGYDVALDISDGSMCLFDGQAFLHGVTPIKKINEHGERYTIVWYSLKKMWHCLSTSEEVAYFNQLAEVQAHKKAAAITEDG